MGHLLATVNPEAAAAIKPVEDLLPSVGHIVKFFPRPGEGRGGRTDFCMIVTNISRGLVDGVVVLDANDYRDCQGLSRKSEANIYHAWDFLAPPLAGSGELRDEIKSANAKLVLLQKTLGDQETRLKALETLAHNAALEKRRPPARKAKDI